MSGKDRRQRDILLSVAHHRCQSLMLSWTCRGHSSECIHITSFFYRY